MLFFVCTKIQLQLRLKQEFLVRLQFVYLGMRLKDIVGQHSQKKALLESVSSGRVAHAQLFEGHDGQGVLVAAIAYANAVVCGNNNNSFLKAAGYVHPDIHFVFPTATTKEVASKPSSDEFIIQWRQFLQEKPYGSLYEWSQFLGIENKQAVIPVGDAIRTTQKVSLKSFEGGWKCVVIWHAEKLTVAASNKLLKSIEEPPEKTLFLLVCTDENQVLATIRSRCQRTHFGRLSHEDIVSHLVEKGVSIEDSRSLSSQADGNMGAALALFEKQDEQLLYEGWFVKWVRTAFRAKGNKAVVLELSEWSQELAANGVETQKQFLAFAIAVMRAALLEHYGLKELTSYRPYTDFKLSKFAAFVHGANIIPIINALEKSAYYLERNGNAQMIFTDLSFALTRFLHKKAA